MNPVTKAGGDTIFTKTCASLCAILNGSGRANAPIQHDPQLLQVVLL